MQLIYGPSNVYNGGHYFIIMTTEDGSDLRTIMLQMGYKGYGRCLLRVSKGMEAATVPLSVDENAHCCAIIIIALRPLILYTLCH